MKVALATCQELPNLDGDELHLLRALEKCGIDYAIAPWDGGDAPFLACDHVVVRSTWDYTQHVDAFVAWAARIELSLKAKGGLLMNPASVIRWNTHKRYLEQVAQEGVAIVPTAMLLQGSQQTLLSVLQERGWSKGAVVKPAVSAGSKDTVRVRGLDVAGDVATAQALLDQQLPTRDMMVQPFVEGIADGELSLIYIDGALSHAVNKRPRGEDFRSQPEFGSLVERVEPSKAQREAAEDILGVVGGRLLYGRVDLVRGDDGKPWLMELELVEPSLYLAHDDRAAPRLAEAIARRA